ncbi:MAG: hypothetical protein HQ511_06320 [Rhodospirillales bacterium]|nr:hypothetical protein [Rhodospirillales bacterium]
MIFAKFVRETTLFLGPDSEIITNHDLAPRTDLEERAIRAAPDAAMTRDTIVGTQRTRKSSRLSKKWRA